MQSKLAVRCRAPLALLKSWMLLCILLSAVQHPRAARATDDVVNVSPCELERIINQLVSPNADNQLHASALRSQLRSLLRERISEPSEQPQSLNDYDYTEEDKRSVAALAAQGLLHNGAKRSLATLAKNGQLPTSVPEESENRENGERFEEEKRYVGSLARAGGYGKRNVGALARDFQLPQNGKRNMATLARLGLLSRNSAEPKRNVAAVARYNSKGRDSNGALVEKRNLGALKASPVHGAQQKRDEEDFNGSSLGSDLDYYDSGYSNYWWYPNYVGYADLDWGDFGGRAQKRFLDTSKDPELFGIENAGGGGGGREELQQQSSDPLPMVDETTIEGMQKRHIGAVLRSGFLPSYRALRSTTTNYGNHGKGRFSRSGRARQFVEFFPQLERLRQPTAAACKRCFVPTHRPLYNWGFSATTRGRNPKYIAEEEYSKSISTNSFPTSTYQKQEQQNQRNQQQQQYHHHHHIDRHPLVAASSQTTSSSNGRTLSWGTPPRIAALHRREFRRQD